MIKTIKISVLLMLLPLLTSTVSFAQEDVRVLHRKLKSEIEKSYKSKAITQNEYNKMLEEHRVIEKSIEMFLVDGELSPDEKNKVLGKINRSKKRLVRYKHNKEVY